QVSMRIGDPLAVSLVPAQIGLLHDILGLAERTQHPVGKAGQVRATRLEDSGLMLLRRFRQAALRETSVVAPSTLIREQDLPYPRTYLRVGNMRAAVIPKPNETSA